ncbi:hypothetical protein BGZ99_001335 [Dissophora globulifera]|uniref:Uncharacterized protein n=1 Tax=Dissophora globulifera TaxID=979702 RepID=A0A9P6UK82_9FUNG|nr:hypothetical protein BGZ99_001335 [Dissophora globulifera]
MIPIGIIPEAPPSSRSGLYWDTREIDALDDVTSISNSNSADAVSQDDNDVASIDIFSDRLSTTSIYDDDLTYNDDHSAISIHDDDLTYDNDLSTTSTFCDDFADVTSIPDDDFVTASLSDDDCSTTDTSGDFANSATRFRS